MRRDRALSAVGWEVQRYGSNDVHLDPGPMLVQHSLFFGT